MVNYKNSPSLFKYHKEMYTVSSWEIGNPYVPSCDIRNLYVPRPRKLLNKPPEIMCRSPHQFIFIEQL